MVCCLRGFTKQKGGEHIIRIYPPDHSLEQSTMYRPLVVLLTYIYIYKIPMWSLTVCLDFPSFDIKSSSLIRPASLVAASSSLSTFIKYSMYSSARSGRNYKQIKSQHTTLSSVHEKTKPCLPFIIFSQSYYSHYMFVTRSLPKSVKFLPNHNGFLEQLDSYTDLSCFKLCIP